MHIGRILISALTQFYRGPGSSTGGSWWGLPIHVHFQARGATIGPTPRQQQQFSIISFISMLRALGPAALLHHCTASAYSSPASSCSRTVPVKNACCIISSCTLIDAVHPSHKEEEACSGMLHLQSEKCCTAWMDDNIVNLGSVGSVFHPTCTTSRNSWCDLCALPTFGLGARG